MRLFLYRTLDVDEEGDPLDHGVVKASGQIVAARLVKKRLTQELGLGKVSFKIYPLKSRASSGVLEDWEDGKVSVHWT